MPPPLECEQRAGAPDPRPASRAPRSRLHAGSSGDVLFVPRLWAHGTVNIGEVVGVATPFALREGVDYVAAATYTAA